MSIYRPKKSRYWWIDFYYDGKRYRESSESTRKRDAKQLMAKRKYELSQSMTDKSVNKDVTFIFYRRESTGNG